MGGWVSIFKNINPAHTHKSGIKPRDEAHGNKMSFEVMAKNDMLNLGNINRQEITVANKLTKTLAKVAIEG